MATESKKEIMSSGQYKRNDGFNKYQIKNGYIVLMRKDGSIAKVLDKYETGKKKVTAWQS